MQLNCHPHPSNTTPPPKQTPGRAGNVRLLITGRPAHTHTHMHAADDDGNGDDKRRQRPARRLVARRLPHQEPTTSLCGPTLTLRPTLRSGSTPPCKLAWYDVAWHKVGMPHQIMRPHCAPSANVCEIIRRDVSALRFEVVGARVPGTCACACGRRV